MSVHTTPQWFWLDVWPSRCTCPIMWYSSGSEHATWWIKCWCRQGTKLKKEKQPWTGKHVTRMFNLPAVLSESLFFLFHLLFNHFFLLLCLPLYLRRSITQSIISPLLCITQAFWFLSPTPRWHSAGIISDLMEVSIFFRGNNNGNEQYPLLCASTLHSFYAHFYLVDFPSLHSVPLQWQWQGKAVCTQNDSSSPDLFSPILDGVSSVHLGKCFDTGATITAK